MLAPACFRNNITYRHYISDLPLSLIFLITMLRIVITFGEKMPRPHNKTLAQDLLVSARSLLEEKDGTDFSMRELSHKVGYSVTAVYRCYDSRSDLLKALQIDLFQSLSQNLLEEQQPGQSSRSQIRQLGRDFLSWAVMHPAQYRFMFHTTEPGALLEGPEQSLARMPLTYVKSLIEAANARGEMWVDDAESMATMLFATLHGLVSLHLSQRLNPEHVRDPVGFYDQHASMWLESLLSRSEPELS